MIYEFIIPITVPILGYDNITTWMISHDKVNFVNFCEFFEISSGSKRQLWNKQLQDRG